MTHYHSELSLAVGERNGGELDLAEARLTTLSRKNPSEWQAPYELGFLYQQEGELALADVWFRRSISCPGYAERAIVQAAATGILLGDSPPRASMVREAARGVLQWQWVGILDEFALLVEWLGLDSRDQLLLGPRDETHLDPRRIVDLAMASLHSRSGWSAVRLGDGEGALLCELDEDKAWPNLLNYTRGQFFEEFFPPGTHHLRDDFLAECAAIGGNVRAANVIGVPTNQWLAREARTANLRGITTVGRLLVWAARLSTLDLEISDCNLHWHVDDGGHLDVLVADAARVILISSAQELAEYCEARFGARDYTLWQISAEKSALPHLGSAALPGTFFSDQYPELRERMLNLDLSGTLVLVGAGVLGKQLVLDAAAQGAVAIDIGSLPDKWMGRPTRPGYGSS